MVCKYLVDANVWIALLDRENQHHDCAVEFFTEIAEDEASLIGYTSTIRYEVLRGVPAQQLQIAKNLLAPYEVFELTGKVADTAADIFRSYQSDAPDRRMDKHQFDILHVACGQNYGLTIKSYDDDIERIQNIARNI